MGGGACWMRLSLRLTLRLTFFDLRGGIGEYYFCGK
jgi:hypothetical protein